MSWFHHKTSTPAAFVATADPNVFSDWDNELPLLVYHGVKENCTNPHTVLVLQGVKDLNLATGKNIYAECLVVTHWGEDEVTSSIDMKLTS